MINKQTRAARNGGECNCDWISSASRSIEVAVRKLTGAPGSRSLGQPFHRSNPTIENSLASGVVAPPRSSLDSSILYSDTFASSNRHHAFPSSPSSPLPPSPNYLSDRGKSRSVHIFVPNIQIFKFHTHIYFLSAQSEYRGISIIFVNCPTVGL